MRHSLSTWLDNGFNKYAVMALSSLLALLGYEWVSWSELEAADWAAWVQAIGSVAAVLIAVLVMHWQQARTLERDVATGRTETINMLKAIQSELMLFVPMVKHRLAKPRGIWPKMDINFAIYQACAGRIGMLDNNDLRRTILATYMEIQTFFVTVNNYNFEGNRVMNQGNVTLKDEKLGELLWRVVSDSGTELLPNIYTVAIRIDDEVRKLSAQSKRTARSN